MKRLENGDMVKKCAECDHIYKARFYWNVLCLNRPIGNRAIDDFNIIDPDCPLPDAEEGK